MFSLEQRVGSGSITMSVLSPGCDVRVDRRGSWSGGEWSVKMWGEWTA